MYIRKNNQMHKYKMGNNWIGGRTAGKDFGVIVDHKLNISQ